jgi:hypothetical protein
MAKAASPLLHSIRRTAILGVVVQFALLAVWFATARAQPTQSQRPSPGAVCDCRPSAPSAARPGLVPL